MTLSKTKGINVLSLFDGMGCAWIALREMGIPVNHGYSSEVDKFAIAQVRHNFPEVVHLGSVTEVDVSQLEPIDLLMGGSPCQCFSFAGKRNGMSTTTKEEIYTLDRYLELKHNGFQFEGQSYLFWEYMRILNDIRKYNPNVYFLLENVEMGKKWERVLTEAIGVKGVHINAALVSAQNRKRIYWTNFALVQDDLFDLPSQAIPPPANRGILLKHILEQDVDEKYYLSQAVVNKLLDYNRRQEEAGNGFQKKFHEGDEKMSCLKVGGGGADDLVNAGPMQVAPTNKKGLRIPMQDKSLCLCSTYHCGCITTYGDRTAILEKETNE